LTALRHILILSAAAGMLLTACNRSGGDGAVAARVGERELTWDDIRGVIPDDAAPEDSMELARRFIENWIREEVVLSEAEGNLPEEKQEFAQLIENYRKSLITYAYEQEWVRQKLDTVVTPEEIERYYSENLQNFQLRDYIVKVKFCAVSTELEPRRLKNIRKLFSSRDTADITPWIQACVENAASYYFDEDKWLLWDDFLRQIPIRVDDREAFLRSSRDVEFEKDNNLYLIRITDYQISGSQSPLSFERENIRNMIINRRKIELLTRMREDLYNRALARRQIETFYTKP
jgi:hypothetical protein